MSAESSVLYLMKSPGTPKVNHFKVKTSTLDSQVRILQLLKHRLVYILMEEETKTFFFFFIEDEH